MFDFNFKSSSNSTQDDPWGLNWATDPVDGDPNFGWDWSASGIPYNAFSGDGDLQKLWGMLESMQNDGGAGDNLPEILAFVINMGKADKNDPATLAFFQQYGQMFASVMRAELLLVYSQNLGTPPNHDTGFAAMVNFANSLLNGPLSGVSEDDPILGPIVAELHSDITQQSSDYIKSEFWDGNTFQLPYQDGPSEDQEPINLMGPDGQEIFAEFVFGKVLYEGTFDSGAPFANATNDLFKIMVTSLISKSKDPILLFIMLMIMFGDTKDKNYQKDLEGSGYASQWIKKHEDDLQDIVTEFNTPGYFTGKDGATHAHEWMDKVRRLFIDAEFNPDAGDLKESIKNAYQNIFNISDPYDPTNKTTIGSEYWPPGDPNALAKALNALSQGDNSDPDPTKHIPRSTVVADNERTLTKTFSDRSAAIQTQMTQTTNNDNTVVNTLKSALDNVKQQEQACNQAMSGGG